MRLFFAVTIALIWATEGLGLEIYAHRGVHQALRRDKPIGNFQCTADLIEGASHSYIENTLPSIEAAFAAGADTVEIDIHLTADGDIVIIHDFDLNCRTNSRQFGCELSTWRDAQYCLVEKHSTAFLKQLDAGYGYTSDGGATYPLRGSGVGLIPTLRETLDAFPGKKFLLDFKGDDGDTLAVVAKILSEYPPETSQNMAWYGLSSEQEQRVQELMPLTTIFLKDKTFYKKCLAWILTTGWVGYVPDECRGAYYGVPFEYFDRVGFLSELLISRVHKIGGKFVLVFVETAEQVEYAKQYEIDAVFTNHIETVAPLFKPH